MAGAHCNAFLIQDRADVVRMNVVNHEGEYGGFLPSCTDDSYTFDCGDPFCRIVQQLLLVRGCLVAPGLVRVSDWRPPAGSDAGFPAAIWVGVARKP